MKNKTLADLATHSSLVSLSLTHRCRSSWRYPWILLGLDPGSKESACQCRRHRFDLCTRKIPWRRKWQPAPYSCWEKSTDRRTWWVTVHGVTKNQTRLSTTAIKARPPEPYSAQCWSTSCRLLISASPAPYLSPDTTGLSSVNITAFESLYQASIPDNSVYFNVEAEIPQNESTLIQYPKIILLLS